MPANIITINGSPEFKWNVPDSQMSEFLNQLARFGFPETEAAQALQHEHNKPDEYIEVKISCEDMPVWGDNVEKINPVMSFRNQQGSTFHMLDDDHCWVFLQETDTGLRQRAWIPHSILRIVDTAFI